MPPPSSSRAPPSTSPPRPTRCWTTPTRGSRPRRRCVRPAGAMKPPPRRHGRSSCGKPRAPRCLPSARGAMVGASPRLITRSLPGAPCDRMLDIGAHEFDPIRLIAVDPHGGCRRSEVCAAGRLGDAVARLYERSADLLPDGPARVRAAATARSAASLQGPPALDRWATASAPDVEFVDHRTVGLGSVHGAEGVLRVTRALFELSQDLAYRVDDILCLRSD